MSQIVEEISYLTLLKNPSKKFLHPDTDDFQNLISSSLWKETPEMNIGPAVLLEDANRQTNRQMPRKT